MFRFVKEGEELQDGVNFLYLKNNSFSVKLVSSQISSRTAHVLRIFTSMDSLKRHKRLFLYTKSIVQKENI